MEGNCDVLPAGLARRVLAGFGMRGTPAADLEGLRAVYRGWCETMPFDNVRKMIALRTARPGPLPGAEAAEFLETWLAHGAGGTCWPSSNALCSLLRSLGFEARHVAGAMRDLGVVNHGSVKVRLGGADWLADTSFLSQVPLPLGPGTFATGDPVFGTEVEATEGTHVIWGDFPPNSAWLPCRLLVDPGDASACRRAYEESRAASPFNQRLYARRNRGGELLVLAGHTRIASTAAGRTSRDLSPQELRDSLRAEFGLSAALVEEWVRSGGLDASFEPPSGPKPPPVTGRPPSQRLREERPGRLHRPARGG